MEGSGNYTLVFTLVHALANIICTYDQECMKHSWYDLIILSPCTVCMVICCVSCRVAQCPYENCDEQLVGKQVYIYMH